ncbi:hypothetical protein K7X08_025881 [Anisodus acutangulus]|uniref:Uncharacterized protein n=1 Tax=Anisodus acutangulus TaxID=402998 RepID=A0A9Q1N318_9SOLA|nr:hypothetical protein K7X08_025881 [Anisodus acutangulus]
MPYFLPHRVSPPNKLVVLNQTCLDLPITSSEGRKWGDDEEKEVADNEESSRGLDKGKAPMESQTTDDMNESTEDSTAYTAGPRRSRRARNMAAARMIYARLVKLNQSCVELPTSSSERRKWGDDCYEEDAESNEDGYAQITMDFREPRSPVDSIDSDTPIVRLDANTLHPWALRMLGFTTKEGLDFEGMTEALTTMFMEPADYGLASPRARTVIKQSERAQEVHSQVSSSSSFTSGDTVSIQAPSATPHRQILPRESKKTVEVSTPTYNAAGLVKLNQSCVELPTSSSERRKWGDDCYEEDAESNEDGYAQITMDFREPRSPVDSIDSDTPIVRLDANTLHPWALRMLGFTTKEGLDFEGMTEALTTMFMEPADYGLASPRARTVIKQSERAQEVHSQVSSSSSFTSGDTVSIQAPSATPQADTTENLKRLWRCRPRHIMQPVGPLSL